MKNLRRALAEGELVFGLGVFTDDPMIVEMAGYLDYDFVFLDTEQSATGPAGRGLEQLVRAADASGIAPTVRVSEFSPYYVNSAINLGAQAVWVPHVESGEQAEAFVRAARYPPRGARGAAPVVRGAKYGIESVDDYRRRSDGETLTIAVVESLRGVENVHEIAAVDGLDVICFGTFDFAMSLGLKQREFYGGGNDGGVHPEVRAAGEACLQACTKAGMIPATAAWSQQAAEMWIDLGFRLLLYGLDTALILAALRSHRAQVDELKRRR